jgi:hypothetical protein
MYALRAVPLGVLAGLAPLGGPGLGPGLVVLAAALVQLGDVVLGVRERNQGMIFGPAFATVVNAACGVVLLAGWRGETEKHEREKGGVILEFAKSSGQEPKKKEIRVDFQINGSTVTAVGSMINGRERVFINDVEVSKKRSFMPKSSHKILIDDEVYHVEFDFSKLLKNWGYCRLKKDGKSIKEYKIRVSVVKDNRKYALVRIGILAALVACGFLWSYFNLNILLLVAVFLVLVIFVRPMLYGDMKYEAIGEE